MRAAHPGGVSARRWVAPLALLWGCAGTAPPPAVDAGLEARCSPQTCAPYGCDESTGHCLTQCRGASDCVTGFLCDRGFCIGSECTVDTADVRCGGFWCVGGLCSTDCTSAVCAQGFYCQGETRRCEARCTSRDDPRCGGFVCDLEVGECEPYCFAGELPCASGFSCDPAMRCVQVPDGG